MTSNFHCSTITGTLFNINITEMREFWKWLTTSRYTRRLEDENAELKAEIAEYKRLLIRGYGIQPIARPALQSNDSSMHGKLERTVENNVPGIAKLGKRINWTEARNKLETLTSKDLQTEARMQKAVNAHANL